MNGISQVNHSHIHWETPKGDEQFGKTLVSENGKLVPLTLNYLTKKFKLELDSCADNQEASMCNTYYTPEQDGLKQPWNVPTIFNPPFQEEVSDGNGGTKFVSCVDKWVMKAVKEAMIHPGNAILGIIPAYISTPWFHDCIWDILPKDNIIPIKGRMHYWDPIEKRTGSPNFDQFLIIWLVRP